jgi:hypothetical protein
MPPDLHSGLIDREHMLARGPSLVGLVD